MRESSCEIISFRRANFQARNSFAKPGNRPLPTFQTRLIRRILRNSHFFQTGKASTSHFSTSLFSYFSGHFKGYGLVLYSSKASSIQARHVLEGTEVRGGHVLDCDWLKFGLVEEVSLHSKCLFIDRLPDNYRDMGEFRKLFSAVVNPPYCQVRQCLSVL